MNILLMTGTIKPLVNVKHCNPEKRLKEYVDNITRYICSSNFDVIIFAENSGYSFDYKKYEEMAKSKGKVFLSRQSSKRYSRLKGILYRVRIFAIISFAFELIHPQDEVYPLNK